jgi:hypothetical protein
MRPRPSAAPPHTWSRRHDRKTVAEHHNDYNESLKKLVEAVAREQTAGSAAPRNVNARSVVALTPKIRDPTRLWPWTTVAATCRDSTGHEKPSDRDAGASAWTITAEAAPLVSS